MSDILTIFTMKNTVVKRMSWTSSQSSTPVYISPDRRAYIIYMQDFLIFIFLCFVLVYIKLTRKSYECLVFKHSHQ